MPPITTDDTSSSTIACLLIIPFAILFAGTAVAITCSEKWNKSDNKLKRFLTRKKSNKKRVSTSTIKTEETHKSEGACRGLVSSESSDKTIAVRDPQGPSELPDSSGTQNQGV